MKAFGATLWLDHRGATTDSLPRINRQLGTPTRETVMDGTWRSLIGMRGLKEAIDEAIYRETNR